MIINADLHIHGRYSMATSKNMTPEVIAPQAKLKGLDLVGTGDVLNSKWLQILDETIEETEIVYQKRRYNRNNPLYELGVPVISCRKEVVVSNFDEWEM